MVLSKQLPHSKRVFTLRVTLMHIEPPIWRQVEVRANVTLYRLHQILQAALGWTDSHLYGFLIGADQYGDPDIDDWMEIVDARNVRLFRVMLWEGTACGYLYDFGDNWQHVIFLESVQAPREDVAYPRCTGGARACPPEDVGGIGGFEELLEAISDPTHEEHDRMLEWAGRTYDPENFDLDAVNTALTKFQPRRRSIPATGT